MSEKKEVHFDDIMPRLVAAYECGRLIPFIGSGMSISPGVSWERLIQNLEDEADIEPPSVEASATPSDDLIRRANVAVRKLKRGAESAFIKATKTATFERAQSHQIPEQTKLLGQIWWPLVLTTNYDNLYEAAFAESFPAENEFSPQYSVVGRSPEDCQRVLNSLSVAGRALIWALQGYFHAPMPIKDAPRKDPTLHKQLVIGHEEYRRVTNREIHFRRAFAEVFRQRSLLFLGSGINERYLQELFGEVLELYGPSARPHYALMPAGKVDPDFMLSRFQIVVATYSADHHEEVRTGLRNLKEAIESASSKQIRWTWGRASLGTGTERGGPELEVVRGPLPDRPPCDNHGKLDTKQCLAVSAGGRSDHFFVSEKSAITLKGWGVTVSNRKCIDYKMHWVDPPHGRYVRYSPEQHVYAVRARSDDDKRNLSAVYKASLELFENAGKEYRVIHMQLLATGGHAHQDVRPFPTRFSFIQTVRAYAQWARDNSNTVCRLIVYVREPLIGRELASGRIDVTELLSCADIRFWAEVRLSAGEIERRLFQVAADKKTLQDVVDELNLVPEYWTVEVTPPPSFEPRKKLVKRLEQDVLEKLVVDLGIVPGSTLHFSRSESGAALGNRH